jgi:EAL domain-containing protein (putative c-di-GMP-specific phosphodiesterase class I)
VNTSPILDAIVAPGGLTVAFEPIVDVSAARRRLHGMSAAVRGPRGTNVEEPAVLFEYARRKRAESQLDRAAVRAIFEAARALPSDLALCLKAHASTLGQDHDFISYLADEADTRGIALSRLVLEIVEQGPAVDGPCITDALDALRHLAVGIALSGVGLGQSSYRMVLDCRPNYFKVDRYVVQGAHQDFYRRAVLESIQDLARKFGARVVAQGVTAEADLQTVTAAGIELAQGAWFAAPSGETLKEANLPRAGRLHASPGTSEDPSLCLPQASTPSWGAGHGRRASDRIMT